MTIFDVDIDARPALVVTVAAPGVMPDDERFVTAVERPLPR